MVPTKRFLTLAAYAALGPVTGPCVAGVVRNLRGGAPILAGLYVVAAALFWLDMSLLSTWSAHELASHLRPQ